MDAKELNRFRFDVSHACRMLEVAEQEFAKEKLVDHLQGLYHGQREILKRLENIANYLYLAQHPGKDLPPDEEPD